MTDGSADHFQFLKAVSMICISIAIIATILRVAIAAPSPDLILILAVPILITLALLTIFGYFVGCFFFLGGGLGSGFEPSGFRAEDSGFRVYSSYLRRRKRRGFRLAGCLRQGLGTGSGLNALKM